MKTLFTDEELLYARIEWPGEHNGIKYLIACTVRTPSPHMEYAKAWATYILLSEVQHEEFKAKLNDAPWNCGQTYYRKHSEEFLDFDLPLNLKAKWDGGWYRMGDDFQHLSDDGKYDMYDLRYMKQHIENVIDFFTEKQPSSA